MILRFAALAAGCIGFLSLISTGPVLSAPGSTFAPAMGAWLYVMLAMFVASFVFNSRMAGYLTAVALTLFIYLQR